MSGKKCARCGKIYPSSYRSCPYCSERRGGRRPPDNPIDRAVDFLREHGERIFLICTTVFLVIAVLGMLLTRRSDPESKPADPPEPPEEIQASPAEPDPAPEPAPDPAPEPEPEGESVMAGDTYTIAVTLEGGSGRASVESPAKLRYSETGVCWATIVWSSPNFDYMKVNGVRYELISAPGSNSAFEIPVAAFDQPFAVIADTVAMSEPHEVEYTLTFHSDSLTKQ